MHVQPMTAEKQPGDGYPGSMDSIFFYDSRARAGHEILTGSLQQPVLLLGFLPEDSNRRGSRVRLL